MYIVHNTLFFYQKEHINNYVTRIIVIKFLLNHELYKCKILNNTCKKVHGRHVNNDLLSILNIWLVLAYQPVTFDIE